MLYTAKPLILIAKANMHGSRNSKQLSREFADLNHTDGRNSTLNEAERTIRSKIQGIGLVTRSWCAVAAFASIQRNNRDNEERNLLAGENWDRSHSFLEGKHVYLTLMEWPLTNSSGHSKRSETFNQCEPSVRSSMKQEFRRKLEEHTHLNIPVNLPAHSRSWRTHKFTMPPHSHLYLSLTVIMSSIDSTQASPLTPCFTSVGCVLANPLCREPLPPARWSLGKLGMLVNAVA